MPNIDKKLFCLDKAPSFDNGCGDVAVFEKNTDGVTATCITADSCRQVSHGSDYVSARLGEIRTIESLLADPYLLRDDGLLGEEFNEMD